MASEIYDSASGASDEETSLEAVYQKLETCSTELSISSTPSNRPLQPCPFFQTYVAIQGLGRSCQEDCDKVLRIVRKQRDARGFESGDSSLMRRWKSVRGAMKAAFEDRELKGIEKRLQRSQTTLTVHLCAISSRYHEQQLAMYQRLQQTSDEYQTKQGQQLGEIRSILGRVDRHKAAAEATTSPVLFQTADIKQLEQQMSSLSITTKDVEFQQKIIASLTFPRCHARYESIADAHEKTFPWALQGDDENSSTERLNHWLATGSGVFWVSGRAGSGKSTLIKYVVGQKETITRLASWAKPHAPVVASHYFWYRGTAMQKSQQGLLQSLLLDVFRHCPQLITHISADATSQVQWVDGTEPLTWSLSSLRNLLQRLANEANLPVKLCFFIDGLDEYYGDHLELTQHLLLLSKSPYIKLCVAGRPWNVFEDAFGHSRLTKLYMHELNRKDIMNYASHQLHVHPRWDHLRLQNPDALSLITEIADRAQGVFLWVFLVVKQLRQGLNNDDSFSDLLKRLGGFPTDLEEFFRSMLESVEDFYHAKMATALRMTLIAREPLEILHYHFLDVECDDLDYTLNMSTLESMEKTQLVTRTSRRLNGYCCGLVYVKEDHVEFLHRTVADFLEFRDMSDFLTSKSFKGFEPMLSILKSSLALLKSSTREVPRRISAGVYETIEVDLYLRRAMTYAHLIQQQGSRNSQSASICLIRELDKFMGLDCHGEQYFRERAIQHHLADYLDLCLGGESKYLHSLESPAICLLFGSELQGLNFVEGTPCTSFSTTFVRMLSVLLQNGQNPNEPIKNSKDSDSSETVEPTPWTEFIRLVIHWKLEGSGFSTEKESNIFLSALRHGAFQTFLEHGADPNALVYREIIKNAIKYSTSWTDFIMAAVYLPLSGSDRVAYLRALGSFIEHRASLSWNTAPRRRDQTDFTNVFFRELEYESSHSGRSPETKQFLADITMRLLIHAPRQNWPMSRVWPILKSSFTTRQYEAMRARFHQSSESTAVRDSGNKRIRERSPESLGPGGGGAQCESCSGRISQEPRAKRRSGWRRITDDKQLQRVVGSSVGAGTVEDPYTIDDSDD